MVLYTVEYNFIELMQLRRSSVKGNLVIYLACVAQLVTYGAIHYFARTKFAAIEATVPFRTFMFVLYSAPVLGMLAAEFITPFSMAKSSIILLYDYFLL